MILALILSWTVVLAGLPLEAGAGAPCPSISFLPASLANGAIGVPYDERIVATGGQGPYSYSGVTGSLPPGLTLSPTGYVQGSPTAVGSYTLLVQVLDANSCSGSRYYTVVVGPCPTIVVNPVTLPEATAGVPYLYTVSATGGLAPYHFSVLGGAGSELPPGLRLTSAGRVTGTPTATGEYDFVMRALDANLCSGSVLSTITVGCPSITIGGPSVIATTIGALYDNFFVGLGGTAPYTFSVVVGSLPPGLDLSAEGRLRGTPTTLSNGVSCWFRSRVGPRYMAGIVSFQPLSGPPSRA